MNAARHIVSSSVLFRSLCENSAQTGWNSWKCPSCSVHRAAFHPTPCIPEQHLPLCIKPMSHLTPSLLGRGVKLFALSLGQRYCHCIWHLPAPDITISWVVEPNDFWHEPGEDARRCKRREGELEDWGTFHKLILLQHCLYLSIHPYSSLESVSVWVFLCDESSSQLQLARPLFREKLKYNRVTNEQQIQTEVEKKLTQSFRPLIGNKNVLKSKTSAGARWFVNTIIACYILAFHLSMFVFKICSLVDVAPTGGIKNMH